MSEDWNTKYGPRRVRRDPPTLDEAIFAAIGITDDRAAGRYRGVPHGHALRRRARRSEEAEPRIRASATRVIAGEQGAQRSIVVERRVVRRFGNDKRTGTLKAATLRPAMCNSKCPACVSRAFAFSGMPERRSGRPAPPIYSQTSSSRRG